MQSRTFLSKYRGWSLSEDVDFSSQLCILSFISTLSAGVRIRSCASFGYMWSCCINCCSVGSFWSGVSAFCVYLGHSYFRQVNYYIAFVILSNAMEDPDFGIQNGIHIVNIILNYFYLGLLILCFLLALGNRPQGSKWGYTSAIIGFGFITIYMTVSSLSYSQSCLINGMIVCCILPRL